MSNNEQYIIGIDYGTDSVRSVLLDTDGIQHTEAVHNYRRWSEGRYCNSAENQFRHHPKDYLEGLEATLKEVIASV